MEKEDKTKQFLEKLKNSGFWNNDYDYSKFKFINTKIKGLVIYKNYGTHHYLKPESLFQGTKCGIRNSQDKNKFVIAQFVEKHGFNKYNYSKFIYKGDEFKGIIICLKCNKEFMQEPTNHKKGTGCPYCANNINLTTNEFIEKAKIIHNNLYNYDSAVYINNSTKIKIKHLECGKVFEQRPASHLNGNGCPHCYSRNKPYSIEDFITKAKKVHRDKKTGEFLYKYDNTVKLNGIYSKIIIECHRHGKFLQMAATHLHGAGCPKCGAKLIEDRNYLPYEECKTFIKTLGFMNKKQWDEYVKSGNKPDNIPHNPQEYYKNNK